MEISIHVRKLPFTKLFLFLLLLIPVCSLRVSGQNTNQPLINSTLSGRVIDDATKQPLQGAVVHIKGTTHAVSADEKGRFNFVTGQKFPYTLIITFIGYQTLEVSANGSPIEISLKESVNQLNDVVVVGYGTQKKSDITGSISFVPKENLNQPTPSVDNLLRGAAPGVQVTQSSGQPGASASVRIRGGNSITGGNEPLYVIDGFPIYNDNSTVTTNIASGSNVNALASINPSDIESIEVLKDASSTAIYGSRGANGVVIITTKKGKKGTNDVSYAGYYGIQKISRYIPLLNGAQWASLRNDIQTGIGQPPSFTADQITAIGQGTNWQKAEFRTASIQSHEISIHGGDEKSRYAVSGSYLNQDGIIVNTGFKRYDGRINYDRDVSSRFKFGVNATGSYSQSKTPATATGSNSLSAPNLIVAGLANSPAVPLLNADGSYNVNNPYAAVPSNPILDLKTIVNQTNISRLLGNFYAEFEIVKGLKAKVSAGADLLNTKQNYFAPSNTGNGYATVGYAAVGSKNVNTWLNENTLTYDRVFGNHSLNIVAGYTTQTAKEESVTAASQNFVNGLTSFNSIQSGSQILTPFSDSYKWALNSFLARVNYSYLHRYNLTISGRADGSSRFGAGNKWGYFPSAGFSWNAGEEEFVKNISAISDLKLRVSAGETGNQEIGQYQSLATLSPYNYDLNGKLITGFAPNRLANPNLKWEKTAQYDAGIDVGLLNSRINLTFDAYYKKTSDLLLNVPIPLSSGYATSLQNIGSVSNKGIELGLNTVNIKTSDGFSWKSSLVYSLNRNKVLSLGPNQTSFFPSVPNGTLGLLTPVIIKVGLPLNTFWGYRTNGIWQTGDNIASLPSLDPVNTKPGDRRYKDIDGNGTINPNDKVNLGSAQAKFTGSFTNTFSYKGFDLLVFLQGSYGNKIYNALHQQLNITNLVGNSWGDVANRWTATNPSNSVPRAANAPVAQMSDYYIENGSYLRLKTLSLGYTISLNALSKIHIKQLRVYVTAQNLATWTHYTGFDPEVSSFEQNNGVQGIDYGAYPNYRTFLVGLNLTL